MCRECTPGGRDDHRTTTPQDAAEFERHARGDVPTIEDALRPTSLADVVDHNERNDQ